MRLLKRYIRIVMIALIFLGCEQKTTIPTSGQTIKIGIIAPFSGSGFSKGKEGMKGVRTAIKMRPLLDNGDKIEIIVRDDQDDPVKATKALKELTQTEQVAAVVTFSSSGPVLAMAQEANFFQTPILAVLATHPEVTRNNDYVSQICFDNNFQGNVAAFFVRDELLIDRVAIFKNPNSFYSMNLAEEFEKKFIELGGEVTDRTMITQTTSDLSQTLKRVREKDPELLYMPVAAKDVIAIMETVDKIGWNPREMVSDGLLATILTQYKEHLNRMNGLLATDFFHYSSQETPFSKRAIAAHEGRGTSYTAMGVEGFSILLDAMNRCDDASDRECINREVRSTSQFEGLLGKISIGKNGKASRPVVINAIKNNKLEYIVKVY